MVSFDVPSEDYVTQPFEDRYSLLISKIDFFHPFLVSPFFVARDN